MAPPSPTPAAAAPSLSDAQTLVLAEAEAARVAASGKPYQWSGSTTSGFDCSGFVIYVFNKAYGVNTLARVTADQLRTQGRFPGVTGAHQAADLVFFSKTAGGSTASHVGIVIDDKEWIGSQSSTGVARVKFSNSYWKPLIMGYGRYELITSAHAIIPMRAGSFASPIRMASTGQGIGRSARA